jgi:hypothetical protein
MPKRWHLHLGVHKTATTHLQAMLDAHRASLAAQGVDTLTPDLLRPLQLYGLRRSDWCFWAPRIIGDRVVARRARDAIGRVCTGGDLMVVSDEDLLGWTGDAVHPAPYPHARDRLRALVALTEQAEVTLFLSVRSWASFLPSAYVQLLRWAPMPGGFPAFLETTRSLRPRWNALAERLLALFPAARALHVWRYEDYRAHQVAILTALTGVDDGWQISGAVPVQTRSPSAEAIGIAEALDPALAPAQRRSEIRHLFDAADPGVTRFDPLTPVDRAGLEQGYREDLARLGAMERVILMNFDRVAMGTGCSS